MTPETAKAMYRRRIGIGKPLHIRRYTGTGTNRPRFDAEVRARITGYAPDELVGTITQGDRKVIFLAEDLIAAHFPTPITTSDKVVEDGKELAIIAPDKSTREVQGVLIAYEMTVRG